MDDDRVLKVSCSGYYDWQKRQLQGSSSRECQRQARDAKVKDTLKARKGRNGSPNLTRNLQEAGIIMRLHDGD